MRGRKHDKAPRPEPADEATVQGDVDETAEQAEPGHADGTAVTDEETVAAPSAGEDTAGEVTLESMQAEMEDLKDRHLRLAAEFDNFRKRTRREQTELRAIAQADVVRQVLPTLDDLARVAATPTDTTTVAALEQGIELILKNLRKQLEDVGLERIEAEEGPFNPEEHQAVLLVPTDDPALDDTVARVFLQGYRFRDRLVRPAQVEVRSYEPEGADEAADELPVDGGD